MFTSATRRYLDVTKYLDPGENGFYYYNEQRPDLPMGMLLRLGEAGDEQSGQSLK